MLMIDKPMPEGCDVCPLMYDYIQCRALPEGCEDDDAFNFDFDWTKRPAWCPLKEQPQIVRCKDCKHRPTIKKVKSNDYRVEFPEDSECPCQNDSDQYYSWYPDDEWFCPMGERRTE